MAESPVPTRVTACGARQVIPQSAGYARNFAVYIKLGVTETGEAEVNSGKSECACGCGGEPAGGNFLPGHDQRLRADLERRIGGLIPLRMLVEASEHFSIGTIQASMFNNMVKDLFRMREGSK